MEAYELYLPPVFPKKKACGFKVGNKPWNKGKTWDEQHLSEETKRRMLESLARSRPQKGEKRAKGKPVVCFDLQWKKVDRFKSVAEASRQTKISPTSIYQACIKKCSKNGFYWKYEEEQ